MIDKRITIKLAKHDATGLLAATSDDLHGLVVFGNTPEEIEKKLPTAIRELLEASNETVDAIAIVLDERSSRAGFGQPAFIVNVSLVEPDDGGTG